MLSIDPLLFLFKTKIEDMNLGSIRACADDIGASLRALYHLPILDDLFHRFRIISGLVLKAPRCIMILSTVVASDCNKGTIKRWLEVNCPRWCNFQIANFVENTWASFWDLKLAKTSGRNL